MRVTERGKFSTARLKYPSARPKYRIEREISDGMYRSLINSNFSITNKKISHSVYKFQNFYLIFPTARDFIPL